MKSVREIIKEIEHKQYLSDKFGLYDTKDLSLCVSKLIKSLKIAEKEHQRLINKVNKVTSSHRHGFIVPNSDLTDLSNRQIEVEEGWEEIKEILNGVENADT